ncbi:uncharacterized protein M6B38_316930 [Iris pallida]|uniref:Uncharacterized protein n=1 Tax=Iris pallida TaxID=29817 RepID=A0AAX6HE61_IRIPA|nr:uncharacterized protein M6B38_316930 [Iris pallida]
MVPPGGPPHRRALLRVPLQRRLRPLDLLRLPHPPRPHPRHRLLEMDLRHHRQRPLSHPLPRLLPLPPTAPFAFLTTAVLTFLNYRGLHIVGLSAVLLTAFSLSPFVVMSLLSVPKLRPARWLEMRVENVNLSNYFNCMFWNLNYWDKASTLAGEVEDPGRTFPKAVFGAVVLVVGVPGAAAGGDGSDGGGQRRAVDGRVLRGGRGGDRRGVARVVDTGCGGGVECRAFRGGDEQRLVSTAGDERDGDDTGDLFEKIEVWNANHQYPMFCDGGDHLVMDELSGDSRNS